MGRAARGPHHAHPGRIRHDGRLHRAATASRALAALAGEPRRRARRRVLSPVTRNQQFVCQGANYRQHMIESGMDPDAKTFNMIFTKAPSCIVPADSDVVRAAQRAASSTTRSSSAWCCGARSAARCDGHRREPARVRRGAVIVNDYSARDIQIPQMQFYKGKSFRTFGPVGPYLCLLERERHRRG